MRLFLTKAWGWSVPVGPLQFSTSGWRERALTMIEPGDRVVLVGTKGDRTPDNMKGRFLGAMEPAKDRVRSLDFAVPRLEGDYKDGKYKWPYGLNNSRAWSFPSRPLLSDLIARSFNMDSAQGIVLLTNEESERIMELDWHAEDLLKRTAQAEIRINSRNRPTAPPPTTSRRGVMHMRRANAYTYAMNIEGARSGAFKVGWAFDYKRRAAEFNHAAMPDLGGLKYVPVFFQLWDTARMAFAMEQQLLREFADSRHPKNREIIMGVAKQQLTEKWTTCLLDVRKNHSEGV